MAQLERDLIVERVRLGLARARAEGRRLGRPPVAVDAAEVLRAHAETGSVAGTARRLGVSATTVRRILKATPGEPVVPAAPSL
jgi:putative DNA-invertase from lambdoid prophage Rac